MPLQVANFGFRYQGSAAAPYTIPGLAAAPWQLLIAEPSTDLALTPDDRVNFASSTLRSGTVRQVYTYLSSADIQRGRDMFADLAPGSVHLATANPNPLFDNLTIDFWTASVLPAYQAEVARQRAQ